MGVKATGIEGLGRRISIQKVEGKRRSVCE